MVGETLRMPISVSGGGDLTFGFEGPDDVPAFNRTASISGSASAGGEFRWTPLASHVGAHEVIIQLLDGGDVVDSTPVVINVTSSTDAAPTFVRPGPGNAYDLAQDPCVRFDIEVRDDDTSNVDIEARTTLPDGAEVTQTGAKSAEFEWCPSDSQAGTAERWTIPLVARDGTHETPLDYIVVLRSEIGDNCPGTGPNVTVISPADGGRLTSSSGWEVRADVTDDMDLRDAPLLFYTTTRPDDLSRPDITDFEQLVMRPRSGEWSARVPSVVIGESDSQTFYIVVSATDNDDPTGSACDHRTDSPVIEFEAVVGAGGGDLAQCEACSTNADCSEGRCAQTAAGGLCVSDCSDNPCTAGSCGATPTTDGAVLAGCGPVEDICDGAAGGYMCMGDDGREEDDSAPDATLYTSPITDGEACSNDSDFFRIPVEANERVTVRLFGFSHDEGDLDLELQNAAGDALASSASTENEETLEYCFGAATTAYARVFGYDGDANEYNLEVNTESGSACCTPDEFEDNNTREDATPFPASNIALATVCPGDIDYFSFSVTAPVQLNITLETDSAGEDLSVRLLGPGGATIATSVSSGTTESISQRVGESGTYMVAIDAFSMDTSEYIIEIDEAATSGCASSLECPLSEVCNDGTCTSRACQFTFSCPEGDGCPTPGPGMDSECGSPCTRNDDCRALEACKWFPQGRFCARRGGGRDGDTCSDFSDCAGQSSCLDWPGGLCARAGCTTNADCGTGTFCFADNTGENVCAPNCNTSDDQCRDTGYDCSLESTLGGALEFLCIPE